MDNVFGQPPQSQNATSAAAVTSVANSATVVNLLVENFNRSGAIIVNTSPAILYVKLGSGATTASYTAKLATDGTFTVPSNYKGLITGIWASATTGAALITELT